MIATKTEQREAKGKALALGLLVAAFMVACLLLTASPAHAKTFTVNTKADSGDQKPGDGKCFTGQNLGLIGPECTLRAAIEEANKFPGADTIAFNIISIPGPALQTIEVGKTGNGALPTITEPATIDGYTQSGATKNTIPLAKDGTNAVLKIELDGSNAPIFTNGLDVGASNSTVKGLVINGFSTGINFDGGDNNLIEGNFIGTDVSGITPSPNLFDGVFVSSGTADNATNNTIGGTTPAARNLIAGNKGSGVGLDRGVTGSKVQGNLIGTKDGEDGTLGNGQSGVQVLGFGNTIGGDGAASNTIGFNGQDGVSVLGTSAGTIFGTGNRILSNSIFFNGGLGIDLGDDGVTPNDPGDPDTGPNNLQNFPVLSSAELSGNALSVTGNLNSTPSTKRKKRTFIVQFFSIPGSQADPSGFGEGKTFIGQATVRTSRTGDAPINLTFTPSQTVGAGEKITATATRNSTGDTSEFSGAVTASFPP